MRALIMYSDVPPDGSNETGALRRLRMYVNSIKLIATSIDLLFYASESYVEGVGDCSALSEQQSDYWGRQLNISVIPRRRRRETNWNHYVTSSMSVRDHPHFFAFCGPEALDAVTEALKKKPDFIHVFTLAAFLPILRIGEKLPPIFFDIDDVEHKSRFRRSIERPMTFGKLLSVSQIGAIHYAERRANRLALRTLVCSETDKRYLKTLGFQRVVTVPNAIGKVRSPPPLPAAPILGFIGNFWHPPNLAAAEHLVKTLWPSIKQQIPGARLLIAGKPVDLLASSKQPVDGVEYLGYVDDLHDFYRSIRVICCPIMAAGGTRVKLIEAALYGRPIVSTRIGAEGLDFEPEAEIYIRKLDRDFANGCMTLLTDWAACQRLGDAARARAESLYDADMIEQRISTMIGSALGLDNAGT